MMPITDQRMAEMVAAANRVVKPPPRNYIPKPPTASVREEKNEEGSAMIPLALTPKEAAALCPLGENGIRKLANEDPLFPAFKRGPNIIIPTKAFEEWLCEQAANRYGFPECEIPFEKRMPTSKSRLRRGA